MIVSDVALAAFYAEAADMLARWLQEPHVARWYPNPADHLAWALEPPFGGEHALVLFEDVPVGYLRWQRVPRQTLDSVGLTEIPAGAVDADILIGEPRCIGRGVGPRALRLLISKLQVQGGVPLLGLTTSTQNHSAHRAFSKAGLRVLRRYTPTGYGECYLMVFSLMGADRDA